MAQIRTVFTLTDNVSPALSRMTSAADALNNALNRIGIGTQSTTQSLNNATKSTDTFTISVGRLVRNLVGISSAIAIFGSLTNTVSVYIARINALVKEYEDAAQAETMLTTVMRQRMNATNESVDSVISLAEEMERLGVVEADAVLMGGQELATYLSSAEAINTLLPAMTNLVVQRAGFTAGSKDFVSAATMMGKVMQGQTGALQRVGYVFSENEKKMLEMGTEMERAAVLADIITQNVGNMNQALANTQIGSIVQAGNRINAVKESFGEAFAETKRMFMVFRANVYEYLEEPIVNVVNSINENMQSLVRTGAVVAAALAAAGGVVAIAWTAANLPLVAIIATIYGIISVVNDLISSFDGAGSALGTLIGFANAAFGAIRSVFTIIRNTVAGVVNLILSVIEPLANIFANFFDYLLDPPRLFIELLSGIAGALLNIGGVVTTIIDAILGTDLTTGINNMLEAIDTRQSDNRAKNTNKFELPTVEYDQVSGLAEYAISGYEFGENLDDKIGEWFSPQKLAGLLPTDGSGNILVSDANTVQLVDEMKDLLARQALERYIVRVNQVSPQVTFENVNISETVDAEAMIDDFVTSVEESTYSDMSVGGAFNYA